MKLIICRIDASFFMSNRTIQWIIQALQSYKREVTKEDLESSRLGESTAFAYYARAAYDPKETNLSFTFDKSYITPEKRDEVKGASNINTLSSWCRIMGFLYDDEDTFDLSELAKSLIVTKKLNSIEICFVNLAKQWVVVEDKCARSLLSVIYELIEQEDSTFLEDLGSYTQSNKELAKSLQNQFFKIVTGRDSNSGDSIQFTRFDALRNSLIESGILVRSEESESKLELTSEGQLVLEDFFNREGRLSKYNPRKTNGKEVNFHKYMSAVENGVFDIISNDNAYIYRNLYPHIVEESTAIQASEIAPIIPENSPLQVIRYGAPGTGKSYESNKITKKYASTIRTTFHPDTDYSSFVGSYKPTSIEKTCYGLDAQGNTKSLVTEDGNVLKEMQIEYTFVKQVFIKAYISAWKLFKESFKNKETLKPQFLVIEEINRGNCAQIFGDIFQLLDRKNGFSEYPIIADEDIKRCLLSEDTEDDPSFGEYGLQLTMRQRAAINRIYDEPGKPSRHIADKICNGEVLALPCNFYIFATMNTSDQSLFPMDSAFKRRWEWQYTRIDYKDASQFKIKIGDKHYDWDEFLMRINKKIALDLHSSAKQLGNRFINVNNEIHSYQGEESSSGDEMDLFKQVQKPSNVNIITEEEFINKVLFYLFTDAYRDDDSFGMYFFDKDESSEGVWLFENIFDFGSNPTFLCQNFIDRLIRDFNINDYLQSKSTNQSTGE